MTADSQESSRRGPIMLVTLKLSLTLYAYADEDAYFLIFVFDGDSKNEDAYFLIFVGGSTWNYADREGASSPSVDEDEAFNDPAISRWRVCIVFSTKPTRSNANHTCSNAKHN
jgi:hypothetical protein